MINDKAVKIVSIIAGIILGVFLIQKVIKDGVAKQTQEIQENFVKEKADIKLKCETEKIEQEAELKKQNAELIHELQKAKIFIEKLKKQTQYSTMIKTDLNGFMKELDSVLGVKGKQKDEK